MLFATLPACTEPSVCTTATCWDSLTAEGLTPISSSEDAQLSIQLCRNGVCKSGTIDTTMAQEPNASDIFGEFDAGAYGILSKDISGVWLLSLQFGTDDPGTYEDGDVVSIQVTDMQTNTLLADIEESVTYSAFSPNGEACGPTCNAASFDLNMQ